MLLRTRIFLLFLFLTGLNCARAQDIPLHLPDSIVARLNNVPMEQRDSFLYMTAMSHYREHNAAGYRMALECGTAGMKYVERYNKVSALPNYYFLLGIVYDALEINKDALKYYKLAYELDAKRKQNNDPEVSWRWLVKSAYNIATIYSRMKNRDSVYRYTTLMEQYASRCDPQKDGIAGITPNTLTNLMIANILMTLGDERFVTYFKRIPDTAHFEDGNLPLGRFYAQTKSAYLKLQGEKNNALQPLLDHLAVAKDSIELLTQIYDLLVEQKRFEEALHYRILIDSTRIRLAPPVVAELQNKLLKIENEQKDWNNEKLSAEKQRLKQRALQLYGLSGILLICFVTSFVTYRSFRSKNKQLRVQNEQISEQSENISTLIREIHHRVKNNLQIISSLIDLQQVKANSANSPELREIQSKMRTIALAHKMIYEQENISSVSLQAYFTEMVDDMTGTLLDRQGLAGKVTYSIDMRDLQMGLDTLIPFAIIINESIVNSIKHAVPDKPDCHISISGAVENGQTRIAYADDGPGLPTGMDPAKSRSLGMRLIRKLAGQIGASMKINSVPGEKLEYVFTIAAS